jgi:hypothetical protein
MSSIPAPDEQTHYSSRRQDDLDALAWPVFSQHALDLLRSAGDVRTGSVKRVASAVGEGSVVISAVHSHLAGSKTS